MWRLQEVEEHRAFPIDLRVLKEDEDFVVAWPHFMLELSDSPELTLACLGLAMHQTIVRELNSECARHLPPGETPPPIELPVVRARILGHEPIIQLKHLKANFYSEYNVLNSDEASKKRTAGGPSMFQLYLDAVSLSSSKNNAGGLASTGDIKFNMQDYYAIQEIHSEPELFRLLVASLCPTIYGHEMVKAGLLLALFGGSPRTAQGSGRSDAHVLVVGDPGLGKSQMLQAVTSVAPRGVYVCGNTSSTAGLTVTLTRESGGDFALEAGALVLADQGCCCIDEFDKIERLKVSAGENLDTIPTQLLRKYVAYARKYVRPKLSEAAAQVLQQFYLRLRAQRGNQDCTPVTTRQLESLIRLTEARAKLELREQATEDDAKDVVELMKHSLLDTFCDELGSLDFQRSQNGSGTSSRSQAKKFVSLLQRRAELQTKSIFSGAELREVASQGRINIPDFSNFLATLNHQGFLLKKGTNLYQLLSVDY
ncbi:hypothetical protein B566_EDAN005043 [Ephemera danica]|nr:hypothetical protein B566_EDAN005043 [Ephemera danica]